MVVITYGYKGKIDNQECWYLTCDEARNLAADLDRAAEEAEDHGSFVATLTDTKDSTIFHIKPSSGNAKLP